MDDFQKVMHLLGGSSELLCKLAEECAELGKAALKIRRVETGVNPTPVKYQEAIDNLVEETADVELLLDMLYSYGTRNVKEVNEIKKAKLKRWIDRLENGCKHDETN